MGKSRLHPVRQQRSPQGTPATPHDITRRQFVLAGLAVPGIAILAGCGGGLGSKRGGAFTLTAANGTVVLPSGATVQVTRVVSYCGASTPASGGSFVLAAAAEVFLPVVGLDASGDAVLYGFLDQDNRELSAASSAVVLAYQALGVSAYPEEVQPLYLAAIRSAASLAGLTSAVAAGIVARGAGWLDASDAALQAALAAIQSELSPTVLGATRGVILDKTDRVSGLQVDADGAGAMTITNYYRRRAYVYVDRVSYKVKSTGEVVSYPGVILPQPIKIAAVKGVSNLLANLGQLIGGQKDFYEPVVSDKIKIPVDPKNAASTTYTATAVGLGVSTGDYASLTTVQKDGCWTVACESLLYDIVLPVLAGVVLPVFKGGLKYKNGQWEKSGIDGFIGFAGTSGAFKDILNAVSTSATIRSKLEAGKVSDALWDVVLMVVKTDTLKNVFLQGVGDFLSLFNGEDAPFGLNGPIISVDERAKEMAAAGAKLFSYIGNVNIGMQAFDLIATGLELGQCDLADVFTLEVTNAIAKLNPVSAWSEAAQAATNFTAVVTNADLSSDTLLNYQWTCKCKFGDISDGTKTNTTDGTSFASNSKVLAYAPNGKAKGGDTEIVQVDIYKGPYNSRVALGTATSVVTYKTPITPATPGLLPGATQTFTANVSDALTGTLTFEWTLSGGHGTINGGASAATTSGTVAYVAGASLGVDTLAVTVKNASGAVLTTGSVTITIIETGGEVTVQILDAVDGKWDGGGTDWASLVALGERHYTLSSATKTPSSLGQFINSGFAEAGVRNSAFLWHGHVPSISAGVTVDAAPTGYAGSLNLYVPYTLNGNTWRFVFVAISGSINITAVAGNRITFEATARLEKDPENGFRHDPGQYGYIDVTVSGYATLRDA